MIKEITDVLSEVKKEYPLSISSSDEEYVSFTVDGIQDSFRVSASPDDWIIGTDSWHEHTENAEGLNAFLHLLFTGEIEIVVKYRGDAPVSHRVYRIEDGKEKFMSVTGGLIFPFWKKKSYKKMEYKLPTNESMLQIDSSI